MTRHKLFCCAKARQKKFILIVTQLSTLLGRTTDENVFQSLMGLGMKVKGCFLVCLQSVLSLVKLLSNFTYVHCDVCRQTLL